MVNIVVSIAVGAAVWAGLFVPGLLNAGEAALPGVLAAVVAYFVAARRSFKAVEKVFQQASQALQSMPPRFDLAVSTLEHAYPLAKHQLGIRSQIDAQIGSIYFLQKEFNKALPYLERSKGFSYWMSAAMLAVIYYKKKDQENMRKTLDLVVKKGKKNSLAWNLCAYLLSQIGDREAAQRLLIEGLKKTKDDPKIKDALLALQNGKKIKMRSYKEQWYQFHLERPPVQQQQAAMGGRIPKQVRRGRW